MMLQQAQAIFIFILRCVIIVDEDFLNLCVLSCVPSFLLNLMFFSKWGEGGFQVLDSPSSLLSMERKFVCEDLGPCILYLFLPVRWMLCFIDAWQVFINWEDFCTIWIVQSCVCIKNGTKPP